MESTKRSTALPVAPSPFRALFYSAQGDWWFDASKVEESGGRTTGLVDYIDPTHKLVQASTGKQCMPPSATGFGSALSLNFVASASNTYRSNRPASAFSYLHAGGGQTTVIVWSPTSVSGAQYIAGNQDAASSPGLDWIRSSNSILHRALPVGGTPPVFSQSIGAIYPTANVATFNVSSFGSASPRYVTRSKSTIVGSGDTLGATPTTNDGVALSIGSRNDAGLYADMRFRAIYGFHRVLTPAEMTVVYSHIQTETGIAP